MKTYPHLFAKLFRSPLMITDGARFGLERELLNHMSMGHGAPPAPLVTIPERTYGEDEKPIEEAIAFKKKLAATEAAWRVEQVYQVVGNVAIVSIAGVIDKHLSSFEMSCYGGCDLADVDRALMLAANDPAIERVVLNINSPGGSVIGVGETAARVAALAEPKEVHAYVDACACSAAYYIASQADQITAAPSAVLGSIGVYLALLDETRALEMDGYKVELMKAGKFKAMGASFKPLTDEERAMFQASVEEIYAQFTGAVRSARPQVSDETMQGQTFTGAKARAAGLSDELFAGNLDEFVAGLL